MTSFLVTYGTGQGQTAKVADRVESALTERGHDVTTLPVGEASGVEVDAFEAVLVGSPVNDRRHLPEVVAFIERNREALAARPSAFFQLSFASAVPFRWASEGAGAYVDDLTRATGWAPDRVGIFAGAVTYTQYDFPTRLFFRVFSALTTGDTDTSRDYEYTDWDAVERFAAEFAEFATSRREAASGATGELRPGLGRRGTAALALLVLGLVGAAYWFVGRPRHPLRDAPAPPRRRSADDPGAPTAE